MKKKFFFGFIYLVLSDHDVFAEDLTSVFYEIFLYLKKSVSSDLQALQIHQTNAFQCDPRYYLEDDCEFSYDVRDNLKMYLEHFIICVLLNKWKDVEFSV